MDARNMHMSKGDFKALVQIYFAGVSPRIRMYQRFSKEIRASLVPYTIMNFPWNTPELLILCRTILLDLGHGDARCYNAATGLL